MYINSKAIIDIFKKLNESDIEYLLIRNINNELPYRLKKSKDIDILVSYEQKKKLYNFFQNNGFKKVPHPHRNNIYLYGAKKFEFLKNKDGLIFDLNYQLMCRSLNRGEWMPLDKKIQQSAWENKRFEKIDENFGYWTLSYNDEFITLIVRSIFDKREFQEGYIKRIEVLKDKIDLKDVKEKMKLVFFKFTPYLLEMIKNKDYENIVKNYIKFKEY